MIVSRFTTFTENFVICCNQVTENHSSRYGFTIASSAWSPCNFGPLTDLASEYKPLCLPKSSRLVDVGVKIVHEKNWRVSLRVHELCHPLDSLNSCSHSGMSEHNGSPRAIVVSSLFRFGFWLAWEQRVSPFYHLFNM